MGNLLQRLILTNKMAIIKCYCTCTDVQFTDKVNLHPLFKSIGKFDKYWLAVFNSLTNDIRVMPNNDSVKKMLNEDGYAYCNSYTLFESQSINLFVELVNYGCKNSTEHRIYTYIRGSKKGETIIIPSYISVPSVAKLATQNNIIKYLRNRV